MKLIKKDERKAIIEHGPFHFLLIKEENGKWYIRRQWNPNTFDWRDFSEPGWGITWWLKPEIIEQLGLSE